MRIVGTVSTLVGTVSTLAYCVLRIPYPMVGCVAYCVLRVAYPYFVLWTRGWVCVLRIPYPYSVLTFGDFVFAANSGNAIRRLIGISRDDLLKRIDDGNSDIDDTILTFQAFETRTIPRGVHQRPRQTSRTS